MPTVDRKSKSYKLFAKRLKAIRPYVDFDFSLNRTPSQKEKRKVKRYYDEISALTNRPNQVYRPRKRGNLAKAQKFAQHEKALPELKVAFIPTNGGERVRVRFNKSGITARGRTVTVGKINFAKRGLNGDAEEYVGRKVAPSDATSFAIQAGRYEIPIPYNKKNVPAAVQALVEQYGGSGTYESQNVEDLENNHWSNWLFGLNEYFYKDQDDFQKYFEEKARNIKAAKRARNSAARRAQRSRGK